MKTKRNETLARRALKTRSRMKPMNSVPSRDRMNDELHELQKRLLIDQSILITNPDFIHLLRGAANEAIALAATTHYPLLLLPGLFEEKVEAARRYLERQARIWKRSAELLETSAAVSNDADRKEQNQ
jgi:hypothetical protein